jgi:hypothetical protein
MALNLIRNARMFFTTNVDATTGVIPSSGFTNANTFEIQVLDGLSFSQATTTETITVNEAGTAPTRGQRQFNTALDPAEITFSTYIRPHKLNETGALPAWNAAWAVVDPTGAAATLGDGTGSTAIGAAYGPNTFIYADAPSGAGSRAARFAPIFNTSNQLIGVSMLDAGAGYTSLPNVYIVDPDITGTPETGANEVTITLGGALTTGTNIIPEEYVLWEAFATGLGASSGWTAGSSSSSINFAGSSKNQLKRFGMIIILDATSYLVDNCSLDQASIDFGLDAISTIAWTARGTELRAATTNITASSSAFTAGLSGSFKPKITTAHFLANKLSTVGIASIARGGLTVGGSATTYTLALTGGNITFANNITYLTPANLGVVNKPVTYFTGTRAISGSLNCYLNTGSTNSFGLMSDMLAQSTTNTQPSFDVELNIGGNSSVRMQIDLDSCVFSIPTINTEQVVSQTLNFTAQGSTGGDYDLAATNEAVITYYAV